MSQPIDTGTSGVTGTLEDESREYKKALLYIKSGDLEKARDVLEEYIETNKRSRRALNKLAFVYLELANLDAAGDILTTLMEGGEPDFYTHYLLGKLLMKRGDLTTAITEYTRALVLSPRDTYTLNGLAQALAVQGQAEKAMRCITKAVEFDPGDVLTYQTWVRLCLERGDLLQAEQAVEAGLAQSPKDVDLLALRANVMLEKGDVTGARALYERLAREYPMKAVGRLGLALVREKDKDLSSAEQEMQKAISVERTFLDAYHQLAAFYVRHARGADAVATYQKALEVAPRDLRLQSGLARAHLSNRHVLNAWMQLRAVLDQDKGFLPARLVLGIIYLDEALYGLACEELSAVLAAEPDNVDARAAFAEALALSGKAQEAETELGTVVTARPDDRQIELIKALLPRAHGDEAATAKALEALAAGKTADRVAKRARRLLSLL